MGPPLGVLANQGMSVPLAAGEAAAVGHEQGW